MRSKIGRRLSVPQGKGLLDNTMLSFNNRGYNADIILIASADQAEMHDSDFGYTNTGTPENPLDDLASWGIPRGDGTSSFAGFSYGGWSYAYPYESMERAAIQRAWDKN